MTNYYIIYFDYDLYHKNKYKLKQIMKYYGLTWDWSKVESLDAEQIDSIYKLSGIENTVKRSGSSGIWSNGTDSVKALMFEKQNKDEHLPVLMICKFDVRTDFYTDFITYCYKIGCQIVKLTKDRGEYYFEFKKQLSEKKKRLMEMIDDKEATKNIKKNIFLTEIKYRRGRYSDSFINGWLRCIDMYS